MTSTRHLEGICPSAAAAAAAAAAGQGRAGSGQGRAGSGQVRAGSGQVRAGSGQVRAGSGQVRAGSARRQWLDQEPDRRSGPPSPGEPRRLHTGQGRTHAHAGGPRRRAHRRRHSRRGP
ncbi:hypothetical protein [Actinoplanes utahensis]|uniref:hypothetical protein n=1 Tax=Actinoplanes utahensis TaxID=1869 RepID=UPI001951156B